MTNIIIQHAGSSFRIEIREHTKSIVCAGVSAIAYTVAGWMNNHPEDIIDRYLRISNGYFEAGYLAAGEKTEAVMEAAIIGLMQIKLGYPDEVKIEEYSAEAL